jgi:hypothetical protein
MWFFLHERKLTPWRFASFENKKDMIRRNHAS